ncbi:MAG TPA: cupin-like domain-containing protein [Pseudoduganella sp.]|jgi:hypothetical protein
MTPVEEVSSFDGARFAALQAAQQPVVVRGHVAHWPAVAMARQSPEALCRYLLRFDKGAACDTVLMPPEARGRLFYSADMQGFNFVRGKRTVAAVLEQVARYSQFAAAPAVAMQSALLDECLPGFAQQNPAPPMMGQLGQLGDQRIAPRLWLGNEVITPAHFDESHNLACVVSGRRRFTLFPPGQVANLYLGPLDFAPTPTPISLVSFRAPDFKRFPRFRQALEHAIVAELEPGDALYIPSLWWHHVESVGVLNAMVNYWWTAPAANGLTKADVLAQALEAP